MTFASTALIPDDGRLVAAEPRAEIGPSETQARKAASRFWNGPAGVGAVSILVVERRDASIILHERPAGRRDRRPWRTTPMTIAAARAHPRIRSCLAMLGAPPDQAAAAMPETLEINGIVYRRDI